MTATYIHTHKKPGIVKSILKLLTILYTMGIASVILYLWTFTEDRFVTSAALKISRQDGSSMESGLVNLALPGLTDSGSMDSQVAIGYIGSADLLIDLEKEFNLVEHYSSPATDFVFRLDPEWKLEDRLEFYRSRISAHFDKDTGLTAVSVDTFDPQLSHKIALKLLAKAESFINTLNQQIADQQLAFVRSEVERTVSRVEEVNRQLLELQNKHRFITPDEVIGASNAAVQELQMTHLRGEAELATLIRDSPGSPQIEPLRSRLRSLQELIDVEIAKLSGPERDRMNQILLLFKELQLKLDFATRLRSGAEMMLEKNRIEASSRSRFFSVIQQPFVPEDAALPRRPYATATILVLALLLFFVLRALVRSIFEA